MIGRINMQLAIRTMPRTGLDGVDCMVGLQNRLLRRVSDALKASPSTGRHSRQGSAEAERNCLRENAETLIIEKEPSSIVIVTACSDRRQLPPTAVSRIFLARRWRLDPDFCVIL
jgi:hypothetical protein